MKKYLLTLTTMIQPVRKKALILAGIEVLISYVLTFLEKSSSYVWGMGFGYLSREFICVLPGLILLLMLTEPVKQKQLPDYTDLDSIIQSTTDYFDDFEEMSEADAVREYVDEFYRLHSLTRNDLSVRLEHIKLQRFCCSTAGMLLFFLIAVSVPALIAFLLKGTSEGMFELLRFTIDAQLNAEILWLLSRHFHADADTTEELYAYEEEKVRNLLRMQEFRGTDRI